MTSAQSRLLLQVLLGQAERVHVEVGQPGEGDGRRDPGEPRRPAVKPYRFHSDRLAEPRVEVTLEEGRDPIFLRITLDEEDELHVISSSSPLRYRVPSEYSRSQ